MSERYPVETYELDKYGDGDDDGTMQENVEELKRAVVGRRIVKAEKREAANSRAYWQHDRLVLTLDNGREVEIVGTDDCCAYTDLKGFWLDPSSVDHVILGVGTTDGHEVWHIYADYGDVMRLQVDWSCGNPFYYGYGFDITVREVED